MGMRVARFLTWTNLAGAGVALVSLVMLLAASPPRFLCESDSDSAPWDAGGIAGFCLLYGIVSFLVSIGLALGVPGEGRTWARRALFSALLVAIVAGGAFFADLARWTCWE
jgi:hypothetical protein